MKWIAERRGRFPQRQVLRRRIKLTVPLQDGLYHQARPVSPFDPLGSIAQRNILQAAKRKLEGVARA